MSPRKARRALKQLIDRHREAERIRRHLRETYDFIAPSEIKWRRRTKNHLGAVDWRMGMGDVYEAVGIDYRSTVVNGSDIGLIAGGPRTQMFKAIIYGEFGVIPREVHGCWYFAGLRRKACTLSDG